MNLKVREGEKAPVFSLKDTYGKTVKLSDFKGKFVVLYFYPRDNTPGCTVQACGIRDDYSVFKKNNIVVLGVSKDDQRSHEKFVDKFKLPFTLLSDTDHKVGKLYGVWGEKKFMGRVFDGMHRVTFVINPKGVVQKVFSKVKTKTHSADVLKEILG